MSQSSSITTIDKIAQNIDSYSKLSEINSKNETDKQVSALTQEILPEFLHVDISDLEFYERCGNGAYGCVYRARWVSRDKEVAVKKLLQLGNEADVLSKLSHRNIIRFYAVVAKAPNFCLITEYANKGSLQSFIASHNLYSEFGLDLILGWAKDIALGMNYLHEETVMKIIHRDLKSTNVVITLEGSDMICKICDFGTSIFSYKTTKMSLIGTFPWMSPEIIQGQEVNKKCDIWSYGVVLWELITGQLPFKGLESFQIAYLIIEKKQRLPIPNGCPQLLSDLMQHCWNVDPKNRPAFKAILQTLEQCCTKNTIADMNDQFKSHKDEWESEIEIVFERLKKIERDLFKKEKILEERERKLHEQEITLINNFKIITIEDYDVNSWREIDVYEWVKKICRNNAIDITLAELFPTNNINGHALLKLTKDDLKNIGISSYGHIIQFYDEIETIKRENTRLLNFPPLKYTPLISSQISTKDVTLTICISAHIIKEKSHDDHKWKMDIDIEDIEDNKDTNILLYIRDVKFVTSYPPFQEFKINKPPFKMPKWSTGIPPHSKVTCTIRYEDKVIKPKETVIEFLLNPDNNTSLIKEITITLENNSEPTSATSTQSNTIINSPLFVAPVNNVVSGVWKNRTLENAIHSPESNTFIKTGNRDYASVVKSAGINKPSCDSIVKSANASLVNTQEMNSPKKYQRFNTAPDFLNQDKRFNSSRSSIASDISTNSNNIKNFKNQSGTSSPRIDDNENKGNTGSTVSNSNRVLNRTNTNGQRYNNRPRGNNKPSFNRKPNPNREQQKP